ncbi:hypothetical protein ACVWZR_010194 [Bradyrhizobium sp. i1.3.1]
MKQRQRRDHALTVRLEIDQPADIAIPVSGMQEICVGEHAALGLSRGSRRIKQRAFARVASGGRRPRISERYGNVVLIGHDRDRPAGLARRGLDLVAPLGEDERRIHLGMRNDVFELADPQIGIDRYDGHAEPVQREPQLDERRPVLEQQPDPLAFAIAPACKSRAPALDPVEHGAVGNLACRDAIDIGGLRQHVEEACLLPAKGGLAKAGVDCGRSGQGVLT